MYRQYSSRNQRNRGIKEVKHVLQICLIVAICFWLIYQIKRSHDNNEDFEESDEKGFLDRGSIGGLIRIRRKSTHPLYEEKETTEEENNHEEGRSRNKKAEEENEALRDGDDETDGNEVERLDTEVYQEEDNRTDEARMDGIDSATEQEISSREQENSMENGGHGRDDKSNQEAREKFYEADGASSAVPHGKHTQTAENEKEVGISDQHHENILEQENKENHSEEANNGKIKMRLEVDGGEISDDANPSSATDTASNNTTSKTKVNNSDSSEKSLSPTDNNLEACNSTTVFTVEIPMQNLTECVPELDRDQGIVTEDTSTKGSNLKTVGLQQANTSTLAVENNLSDSESTGHTEPKNLESSLDDFSRPSNNTFVRLTRSDIRALPERWNQHIKE